MNKDERIQIIQDKITEFSSAISLLQVRLELLQSELDGLKNRALPDEVIPEKEFTAAEPAMIPPSRHANQPWLENFIGLKLVHLVGIIILVIGLSIGVKFAVDEQLVSEGMRIGLAYGAGLLLFFLSARLKSKYRLFSSILFSGSMASIYFTTYAASVYYQFIPGLVAFLLMVALTIYTAYMAIEYNSREIGIIGMTGAYAIPFLISANSERVEIFFSYILLINIGVLFLAVKKSWKLMGQLAMIITWLLFTGWAFFRFEATEKSTAILFLIVFYLLFLLPTLGFSRVRRARLQGPDIWTIVVNNTALYFAAIFVFTSGAGNKELAMVTGVMFLVTVILTWITYLLHATEQLLQRWLIRQAVLYLLLFIAFQWDGVMVTLLWLTVSVVIFGWGVFQRIPWLRLASFFLIGITILKLLIFDSVSFTTVQKIISYLLNGVLLLSLSWYYQKYGLSKKQGSAEREGSQ